MFRPDPELARLFLSVFIKWGASEKKKTSLFSSVANGLLALYDTPLFVIGCIL